jgi:hypothetical protein
LKKNPNLRPPRATPTAAPAFRLPKAIEKQGEVLLEQQMWCWGCDVRRQEGNLLLGYGFQKRQSTDPRYHSAYTYALCTDCALTLWGWGLWLARESYGSLFLSRARFRVTYTAAVDLCPQAWEVNALPPLQQPNQALGWHNSILLLAEVAAFVAHYEGWLATQLNENYRNHVIAEWPQRRRHRGGIAAADLAQTWLNLSQALHKEALN